MLSIERTLNRVWLEVFNFFLSFFFVFTALWLLLFDVVVVVFVVKCRYFIVCRRFKLLLALHLICAKTRQLNVLSYPEKSFLSAVQTHTQYDGPQRDIFINWSVSNRGTFHTAISVALTLAPTFNHVEHFSIWYY